MGQVRTSSVVGIVVAVAIAGALWWWGAPIVVAWLVGAGVATFGLYALDKAAARRGGERVPEATLHTAALFGGVGGAWLGREVLRHKTNKGIFTVVLVLATILWVPMLATAV